MLLINSPHAKKKYYINTELLANIVCNLKRIKYPLALRQEVIEYEKQIFTL